ncbi:MAG TPA: AarF/ABC1/UbiB kinase family protein [Polyangiaceae bacterium]
MKTGAAPRGRAARGKIVGAAALKASARKTRSLLAEPFRNEQERADAADKADADMAKILFDACSVLRGTALKLAQVLATEHEMLPPAYREQFAKASHDVTPIHRALVHRIIKAELGDWREHFSEFCDVPFAAASLGQVHAATNHEGEALAVKLQYPGVADGVASDLSLARAVLKPTRFSSVFESCLDELRERLGDELDYLCEAEHTVWFHEHIRNPMVRTPRVYPEHSTRHVLVTERLPGSDLTTWLATNPSRHMRERYGQLLVELFHECVFERHFIHADPNFGNYLFADDGHLGLIDFGCVRRLDANTLSALRRAYFLFEGDPETIRRIHAELGVKYRASANQVRLNQFLVSWANWASEPYRSEWFDFGQRDYFERGAVLGEEARHLVEACSGAFLYFGRSQQGLHRLLQALDVSVRMRLPS